MLVATEDSVFLFNFTAKGIVNLVDSSSTTGGLLFSCRASYQSGKSAYSDQEFFDSFVSVKPVGTTGFLVACMGKSGSGSAAYGEYYRPTSTLQMGSFMSFTSKGFQE